MPSTIVVTLRDEETGECFPCLDHIDAESRAAWRAMSKPGTRFTILHDGAPVSGVIFTGASDRTGEA
jgi:hypothetical protein